ncbi:MAG TPA: class I SAM-dependent methyltransferase [bacterium]|nr:class I SAM-dependent methyltransferase [bacterium]
MTRVWDELAGKMGGQHDPPGSLPARVHAELRRRVLAWTSRLPGGARVLDLGCGNGQLARLLAGLRPDLEITGMDFSEAMLEAARAASSSAGNPVWIRGDATAWPLPDHSLDAVLCMDMVAHLDPDAEVPAFLSEAKRVCRGWMLLEVKTPWSLRTLLGLRRAADRVLGRGPREFLFGIKSQASRIPIYVHDPSALIQPFECSGKLRPWPILPCPSQVYVLRLGPSAPHQGQA